jgi:hypothetical protein
MSPAKMVADGIQTVGADGCKHYCADVEKLEKEYRTRDSIVENAVINIHASDGMSSSEDEVVSLENESDSGATVVLLSNNE